MLPRGDCRRGLKAEQTMKSSLVPEQLQGGWLEAGRAGHVEHDGDSLRKVPGGDACRRALVGAILQEPEQIGLRQADGKSCSCETLAGLGGSDVVSNPCSLAGTLLIVPPEVRLRRNTTSVFRRHVRLPPPCGGRQRRRPTTSWSSSPASVRHGFSTSQMLR